MLVVDPGPEPRLIPELIPELLVQPPDKIISAGKFCQLPTHSPPIPLGYGREQKKSTPHTAPGGI